VTPKDWIDKSVWREINDILKLHEFGWLSNGRDRVLVNSSDPHHKS